MRTFRLCLFVCLCLLLAGCGRQEAAAPVPLTQEQIANANEAFASQTVTRKDPQGPALVSPTAVSCFFTSCYSDPRELDLQEFLRYCPVGSILEDSDREEFLAVIRASGMPQTDPLPSQYIVPVHRLPREEVSALLETYAGITAEDLKNTEKALYLEQYNAYYVFTSDFGPGYFQCVGGERTAEGYRFWSEPDAATGLRKVLTVRQDQGRFLIQSFLEE